MLTRIKDEPALISGLVVVLLNLGAAFGLNLSGEQTAAINAAVAALLAVCFVRPQVVPTNKLDPDLFSVRKKRAKVVVAPGQD